MASKELVERRFRKQIPQVHRESIDTRIMWLWNQRLGVTQTIYNSSPDDYDRMAASILLSAIIGKNLDAITMLFDRIEGGAQDDTEVFERARSIRV